MIHTLLNSIDWGTLTRLLIAVLLGGIIGFEREIAGKIAGLRTHTLVSLGSCLFTVISILLFKAVPSVNGVVGYDYHLVANIIVGIGFIGAGAILHKGNQVQGTTTAASLWIAAAVGMAVGFGFYAEAAATTIITYLVLAGLWLLERRIRKSAHFHQDETSSTGMNAHGE